MEITVFEGILEKDIEGNLCVLHKDRLYNISSGSTLKLMDSFKEGDSVWFHIPDGGDWVTIWCPRCHNYATSKPEINQREFPVKRLKNGHGHTHLVVITEEAIPDIAIGNIFIVPYAEGFKDPIKVILETDERGKPLSVNEKFATVAKYIYE